MCLHIHIRAHTYTHKPQFIHLSVIFCLLRHLGIVSMICSHLSDRLISLLFSRIIGSGGISVFIIISWFSVVLAVAHRALLMERGAWLARHPPNSVVAIFHSLGEPSFHVLQWLYWSLNICFCLLDSNHRDGFLALPPWAFNFHLPGNQWSEVICTASFFWLSGWTLISVSEFWSIVYQFSITFVFFSSYPLLGRALDFGGGPLVQLHLLVLWVLCRKRHH